MIYILADWLQQPNELLHPCRINMFTEFSGHGYTHVFANPVHRTALKRAGFRLVNQINGNDLFWTSTLRVNDLTKMFDLAFGPYYEILIDGEPEYQEIELICALIDSPTLEELPDLIVRKVSEPANDPETAGMPWNVPTLRYALGYYDEPSFRRVIKGLIRAGKLLDDSGDQQWVSPAVAKIEGFGNLRILQIRRRVGVVSLEFELDRGLMNGQFLCLDSEPDVPERTMYWVFHGICTLDHLYMRAPRTPFCQGSIIFTVRADLPLTDVMNFLQTQLESLQKFAVDTPVSRHSYVSWANTMS